MSFDSNNTGGFNQPWHQIMRDIGGTSYDIAAVYRTASKLPADDTRGSLAAARVRAALRHTDVTYRLWHQLFTRAEVAQTDSTMLATLLRTVQGESDSSECVALSTTAVELAQLCELMSSEKVQELLRASLTLDNTMKMLTVLAQVSAILPTVEFIGLVASHARDEHPPLWDRFVAGLGEAWGVAATDRWRAATREFTQAGDELLRHFNRRAEGGYPANDAEVELLSDLLDMNVTRRGDGSVTVEEGADPWRDTLGNIIHPLGVK